MGWTTPPTFTHAQAMTPAILNTYLRDNLLWLKTRPLSSVAITISTTSTSFVAATGSFLLSTTGGNVQMVFAGKVINSAANVLENVDLAIDGARQGDATNGVASVHTHPTGGNDSPVTALFITSTPPIAGSHTYEVYVKTASGTMTGSGTLYVMEIG